MLCIPQAMSFDELTNALTNYMEAEIITPEWIWVMLDLPNEGGVDEESLEASVLTEFFSEYSTIAKGYKTLDSDEELTR
jgi:hypothetical protein